MKNYLVPEIERLQNEAEVLTKKMKGDICASIMLCLEHNRFLSAGLFTDLLKSLCLLDVFEQADLRRAAGKHGIEYVDVLDRITKVGNVDDRLPLCRQYWLLLQDLVSVARRGMS